MIRDQRVAAVIPARYGSTRFPGKPLAEIAGKPMIQWVHERAVAARTVDETIVATDDLRIRRAVTGFGGRAVMTSAEHATGTDRIAEAVQGIDADIIVNVQGDEPLLPSAVIDLLVEAVAETGAGMGTVAVPFSCTAADPDDPNAVKVIIDANGFALYFSRSNIPFHRTGGTPVEPLWHWGLYAYQRAFLDTFVRWPQGRLEQCEVLEQLRALENGAPVLVIQTETTSCAVDLPDHIQVVERLLHERGEAAA